MPSAINSNSIKHPNTFLLQSGQTQLVREIEAVNQSIRLILTTAVGELWGDPEFGTHLYEYLYEYEGEQLTQLVKLEIVRALNLWEPRIFISEQDINVIYEDKSAIIDIAYNLRYTNYRSSYRYIMSKQEDDTYAD